MIKMLTKNDCPRCEVLKTMLAKPLKGQYVVEIINFNEQPDEFNRLAHRHGVTALPALVTEEAALLDCSQISKVKHFLQAH